MQTLTINSFSSSLIIYVTLVILVALQRLYELKLSKKHETHLKTLGAVEKFPDHFLYMKLIHIFWLISCFYFSFKVNFPPDILVSFIWFLVLITGQILRWHAIKTLGYRWTARIFILPQVPPVTKGLYLYIKHPNYLGVVLEILALPMIFGLTSVAFIFSFLNGLILFVRIRLEEKALYHQENINESAAGNI
jgi:methyltransferase